MRHPPEQRAGLAKIVGYCRCRQYLDAEEGSFLARAVLRQDEEVRFASDSPLEEGGFELPVPLLRKGLPGVADARCLTDRLGGVIKRRSSRETAGALPTAVPLLRDREFESFFLQRRVHCEPDFLGHGPPWPKGLGLHISWVADLGGWWDETDFHETRDTGFLLARLDELWPRAPRYTPLSVGVVLLDLIPAAMHQPDLFAADTQRRQKLSPLIDRINDRYGRCAIGFGLFPADVRAFKAMPPSTGCRRGGSFRTPLLPSTRRRRGGGLSPPGGSQKC